MRSSALRLARGLGLDSPRVGKDALQNALLYGDRRTIKEGNPEGSLHKWPITVKDNFCTLDMPTSCSSKMLLDYQSPIEATAVRLLRQAGADIIAKTNCDEFGMGSANLYSAHGHILNPESFASEPRVAGGSSGGAAAAVACLASRIALASDTGGSIRIPAAYCGVYGLKPSYGTISRWGLIAYADSLDTVGLLGSSSEDIRMAYNVIAQHDRRDPTSIPAEIRRHASDYYTKDVLWQLQQNNGSLSGLRVGVPAESFSTELSDDMLPSLRQILSKLKSRGADIISVELPSTRYALSAYYVLASAEASSNLARYDGIRYGHRAKKQATSIGTPPPQGSTPFHTHISKTRSEAFGEEVKKRILLGTYSLTSDLFDNYFLQAQNVRKLVRRDFDAAFRAPNSLSTSSSSTSSQGVDILVSPSAVGVAPTIAEARSMGTKAYTQDLLTVPASLAGVPAMTVPAGEADGLPVGVTLTAQWGGEDILFHLASILSKI